MSTSPHAFVEAPAAPPELASEDRSEYLWLLDQLDLFEYHFKLGNVDEPVPDLFDSDGSPWIFEKKLDQLEKLVPRYQDQLVAEHPSLYFRHVAIKAEAKEYFGSATPADQLDLYLSAQQLYRELARDQATGELTAAKRATLSSSIRVVVAGLEYLHTIRDYTTALAFGRKLHEFVVAKGLGTEGDVEAPLAIVYQFLGRTLRARGLENDSEEAIDYFHKCNESYSEIALQEHLPSSEIIYARTRAALSLAFGAGFLFYNAKGDLIRAKDAIRPARLAFLRDSGSICCKLYYNYFELLYASILRDEAGELCLITDEDPAQVEPKRIAAQAKLDQAVRIIDRCYTEFEHRPKYFIHVLFNKALVYLYLGPDYYEGARECLRQIFERCQTNPRWLSNAFVVKSHLERRVGNFDAALAAAIQAYSQAGNHLPVKIEALLARGEALLVRNKLLAARADIEKALALNESANLRVTVSGNLLLADVALAQKQPAKAYERLMQVEDLMPSSRHGSLINKYRQLSAKLERVQSDYLITSNTEVLHYKKFEEDLQRWLLEKALREDNNVTRVARRLQVTKKTIYMWLERYKIKP